MDSHSQSLHEGIQQESEERLQQILTK